MKWADFASQLKLERAQATQVEFLLNQQKDLFVTICSRKAEQSFSPIEFLAVLLHKSPTAEAGSQFGRFHQYLVEETDPTTGRPYIDAVLQLQKRTQGQLVEALETEQTDHFKRMEVSSLLDIDTGHAPIKSRIKSCMAMLQKEGGQKLALLKETPRAEPKYKGYFCPLPFEFATIGSRGSVYACSACKMITSVGSLEKQSLMEAWNSPTAIAVRNSIFDGTYAFCKESECDKLQDMTLKRESEVTDPVHRDIIDRQISHLETGPKVVDFSYDDTCNLACFYCRDEMIIRKDKALDEIHGNVFKDELAGVNRLLISGNGDPFASSLYRRLLENLDTAVYPEVKIKIQTNGLLLTPKMWKRIANSHQAIDWISISIDAATPETFSINRGGSFATLLKNLEFIGQIRAQGQIDKFNLNFVVQANNFREMPEFVRLGKRVGCDFVVFQRVMNLATTSINEQMYRDQAVHRPEHPEYPELLAVLEDPVLKDPIAHFVKLKDHAPTRFMAGQSGREREAYFTTV